MELYRRETIPPRPSVMPDTWTNPHDVYIRDPQAEADAKLGETVRKALDFVPEKAARYCRFLVKSYNSQNVAGGGAIQRVFLAIADAIEAEQHHITPL